VTKTDHHLQRAKSDPVFIADILDVVAKGDISTMEHPIFSLSKNADREVFKYENPNSGVWVEVAPSVIGRATIFDKDLLLYCIGQVVEGKNRGRPISRQVRITPYDYLKATRRGTGGKDYKEIHNALGRLRGTTFRTNWNSNGKGQAYAEVFGFIDSAQLTKDEDSGKLIYIDITLSRHLFSAIENNRILTYNPRYFELNASQKRVYELVRKHCGSQPKWENKLANFHIKFGGRSDLREMRRVMRRIIEQQSIPDYELELDSVRDMLIARYCPDEEIADQVSGFTHA